MWLQVDQLINNSQVLKVGPDLVLLEEEKAAGLAEAFDWEMK